MSKNNYHGPITNRYAIPVIGYQIADFSHLISVENFLVYPGNKNSNIPVDGTARKALLYQVPWQ